MKEKTLSWQAIADLNVSSAFHSVATLSDGRVILTGGVHVVGNKRLYLDRTEIYDPRFDRWTPGAPLPSSRAAPRKMDPHALTMLSDGRFLITGGDTVDPKDSKKLDPVLATAIYDPSTQQWSPSAPLRHRRAGHVALLLKDGRVLVAGRERPAEIYDPRENRWVETGPTPYQTAMPRGVVLKDGRVLLTGGYWDNQPMKECCLYDPETNAWTRIAPMKHARSWHMIALLNDGRVLVGGGYIGNNVDTEGIEATPTAEIYDPNTGRWSETGPMNEARYDTGFLSIGGGRILTAGGATGALAPATASCEIFNLETCRWSPATPLTHPRRSHRMTFLMDGRILVTGGFTAWFEDTYIDCEIGAFK